MSEAPEAKVSGTVPKVVTVTPLLVDVYAYLEGEDVLFSHAWKEQGGAKRKKGKIEIPPGQKDTPIHFHLHDKTSLGLAFFDPATEAMYVDLKDCPTCAGNGGQISFDSTSPNLLKVTDANVNPPCTLHFALRFTGNPTGSDGPTYVYDPEIKNV